MVTQILADELSRYLCFQWLVMQIVIRSYLAGSFLLEQEHKVCDAVVILDSGLSHTGFIAGHARRHIYLQFDDVDAAVGGKRVPTLDDVRAACEFAPDSENMLVCRRVGQSHSAAIGFVIGCQRFGPKTACDLLNPKQHIPNSLVIDLGTRLLDNPPVHQAFVKWQTTNKDVKLSDYYHESESEFDELERQGAQN